MQNISRTSMFDCIDVVFCGGGNMYNTGMFDDEKIKIIYGNTGRQLRDHGVF